MTTTTDNTSPMADYFSFEPLLGGDPLVEAWDADLHPDEYGDQSGFVCKSWEDDHASFTDSEFDCEESDDDCDSDNQEENVHDIQRPQSSSNPLVGECEDNGDGDWSIVYSASLTCTVVDSTTTTVDDSSSDNEESEPQPQSASIPEVPPPNPLVRRNSSKVRFCEEPPQVVSYEHCSREEYSQLYYSVHELQKQIDDLRIETQQQLATTKGAPPASIPLASSFVYNNHKACGGDNTITGTNGGGLTNKTASPTRRCT